MISAQSSGKAMLDRLREEGVELRLTADGGLQARGNLSDSRIEYLRSRRVALAAELRTSWSVQNFQSLGESREDRRRCVLAMMRADPALQRAWKVEFVASGSSESAPAFVAVAVAIRDVGTAELTIDGDRYDPFEFLETLAATNCLDDGDRQRIA